MLCDFCREREAALFIEQTSPSGKKKLNLCMQCAAERGISDDPKSIEKMLVNLFSEMKERSERENKVCPVCGTSIRTIRLLRVAGCTECYSIFEDDVKKIQASAGVSNHYVGRMPKRIRGFRSTLTDRTLIQGKLQESIKNEEYEKAAFYRDYLRAMEKTPVTGEDNE